jgi:hypothetical protein
VPRSQHQRPSRAETSGGSSFFEIGWERYPQHFAVRSTPNRLRCPSASTLPIHAYGESLDELGAHAVE